MNHPDEQFVLTTLRDNLRRFESMLSAARAAASQVAPLTELVETTKNAIQQIEAGQVRVEPSEVRPGEFSRMTLLDALISYLEKRGGMAKLREEAIPALVLGGAVTSKDRKPLGEVKENARYRILVNLIEIHASNKVTYQRETDMVLLPK